ncbi:hypothetical protein QTP88_013454 [Uroleucon formosanum]
MVESLIPKKSNIDSYHHNKNEEKLSCTEDNISDIEENVSFTDNDFYTFADATRKRPTNNKTVKPTKLTSLSSNVEHPDKPMVAYRRLVLRNGSTDNDEPN